MLNASKVKVVKKSGNTPMLETANFPARVVQVIDLGLQPRKAYEGVVKTPANVIWVTYELPTEFMLDDDSKEDKEKPRWVSESINLFSLDQENANSTKRINALDPSGELKGDWGRVLGYPCTLTIVHSKCGKYANVGAVSPPMKGLVIGELVNEPKLFDLSAPDMEVYEGLPDFLKEKIKNNLEFEGSLLAVALGGKTPATTIEEPKKDDAPY